MAEVTTIARPYAEAVFEVAKQGGSLAAWSELLQELGRLAAHPDTRAVIGNPKIKPDQLYDLFTSLVKTPLAGYAQNMLRTLIANDRLSFLPQIQAQFEQLRGEHEGVADADVVSAFPMSDDELAQLTAALEKTFKRRIRPTVHIDQELIGGVRVTVGDEVLDASVRGRLAAMSTALQN